MNGQKEIMEKKDLSVLNECKLKFKLIDSSKGVSLN